MIPLANIATAVNNAKLYLIEKTKALRVELETNSKDCKVEDLAYMTKLIKALTYDVSRNFSDANTEELYKQLVVRLDGYNEPYQTDSSVQIPSGTVVFYVGADVYWGNIFGNIGDQPDLIQKFDTKADLPDEVKSGGIIDTSNFSSGTIVVGPTEWEITPTTFNGIALSENGKQRYIVFIGDTNNDISLIQGEESAAAQLPKPLPDNTLVIGYCLVTDSSIGEPVNPSVQLGQGLTTDPDGKITLDLESKPIVGMNISINWTLFQAINDVNGDPIPYNPATSTAKNIIVDKGVRASFSATFQYPIPSSSQLPPLSTYGEFGNALPAPATPSATLNRSGLVADQTWSQTIAKPKSGLVVVGSQVSFPTGSDTSGDSVSIKFQGRGTIAYFNVGVLSASQIQSVLNGSMFQNTRARTFTGVTAGNDEYTYYLYDAALGNVTNVIQNCALPVFTAFQFLTQVQIVNAAGHSMNIIVLRSNAVRAFTNATLAFS
jgi:hypothetical protein